MKVWKRSQNESVGEFQGESGGMEGRVTGREDRKTKKEFEKKKGVTVQEECKRTSRRGERGIKTKVRGEESGRESRKGAGEAPLVLISRNAELGDVSDFGGQTPPGARRGHVCFSPLRLSL